MFGLLFAESRHIKQLFKTKQKLSYFQKETGSFTSNEMRKSVKKGKKKEKTTSHLFSNQLFVAFFRKQKEVLGCCCCWQAFSKKPKEKVNIAELFFERLQTFNLFYVVDAKEVVSLHRQHNYRVVPTKSRNKEQKLVFFLLVSEKKSCYRIVKKRKTCYFGSERKKKLVISCFLELLTSCIKKFDTRSGLLFCSNKFGVRRIF